MKRLPDTKGVADASSGQKRAAHELAGSAVGARAEEDDLVVLEPETNAVEHQECDARIAIRNDLPRRDVAPGQGGDTVRQLRAHHALFL
jgi:hypothetical protein